MRGATASVRAAGAPVSAGSGAALGMMTGRRALHATPPARFNPLLGGTGKMFENPANIITAEIGMMQGKHHFNGGSSPLALNTPELGPRGVVKEDNSRRPARMDNRTLTHLQYTARMTHAPASARPPENLPLRPVKLDAAEELVWATPACPRTLDEYVTVVPDFVSEEEEAALIRATREALSVVSAPQRKLESKREAAAPVIFQDTAKDYVKSTRDRMLPSADFAAGTDDGGVAAAAVARAAERAKSYLPGALQLRSDVQVREYGRNGYAKLHLDDERRSGHVVCALSLGRACVMTLRSILHEGEYYSKREEWLATPKDERTGEPPTFEHWEYDVLIPPRSLYVLHGPARHDWVHAIDWRGEYDVHTSDKLYFAGGHVAVSGASGPLLREGKRYSIIFRGPPRKEDLGRMWSFFGAEVELDDWDNFVNFRTAVLDRTAARGGVVEGGDVVFLLRSEKERKDGGSWGLAVSKDTLQVLKCGEGWLSNPAMVELKEHLDSREGYKLYTVDTEHGETTIHKFSDLVAAMKGPNGQGARFLALHVSPPPKAKAYRMPYIPMYGLQGVAHR